MEWLLKQALEQNQNQTMQQQIDACKEATLTLAKGWTIVTVILILGIIALAINNKCDHYKNRKRLKILEQNQPIKN